MTRAAAADRGPGLAPLLLGAVLAGAALALLALWAGLGLLAAFLAYSLGGAAALPVLAALACLPRPAPRPAAAPRRRPRRRLA